MRPLDPLGVDLSPGVTLVEASAGTGKTHAVSTLFLRLVVEEGLDVRGILIVTFTRAATAEMQDRIRTKLRDAAGAFAGEGSGDDVVRALGEASRARSTLERDRERLERALADFDEAPISTIHGFCQRMLRDNAFESGEDFDAELAEDETAILDEVLADFWSREVCVAPEPFVRRVAAGGSTFELLRRVGRRVAARPGLEVRCPEGRDPGGEETALEAAFGEASCIWRRDGGDVRRLLLDAARSGKRILKGTYYKEAYLPGWLDDMDALMGRGDPWVPFFEHFVKLTPSFLSSQTVKGGITPSHPFFDAAGRLAQAKERMEEALEARRWKLVRDFVACVREEVPRRRRARRVQSFDDLLNHLDAALEGPGGGELARAILVRHRAILVDEFQDTDPVQYRIFRRLSEGGGIPVFLVGDPKQSIYAFRGADVFAYIAAARDAGERTYTLGTNWRSDPSLVGALNRIFDPARVPHAFMLEGIDYVTVEPAEEHDRLGPGPGAPVEIVFVPREVEGGRIPKGTAWPLLASATAADIARLVASGERIEEGGKSRPLTPGDVAVLVRKNHQARLVLAALGDLAIPAVLHSPASVLASVEASEVERVARAMAEPRSRSAIRAALATAIIGVDAASIASLDEDEEEWDGWVAEMSRAGETWRRRGFVQAFRMLLDERGAPQRILALADGERRMTDILHLCEILGRAADACRLGPSGLVRWLARSRAEAAEGVETAAEEEQIRLESDARAVQIVTIHKAKGLEYPVVFCPYLWDGRLGDEGGLALVHDPGPVLDLAPDAATVLRSRRESQAESMRLAYVAMTRARHRCVLAWGWFKDAETSALGLLLHPAWASDTGAGPIGLCEMRDEDIMADLSALAASSTGAIRVRTIGADPGPPYAPPAASPPSLSCPAPVRRLEPSWSLSSFSRLIATGRTLSRPAEAGLDLDEAVGPAPDDPAPDPIPLADFPRGARAGTFMHDLLEHLDFASKDAETRRALVAAKLLEHGFDPGTWERAVDSSIGDVIASPLPSMHSGAPFPLGAIGRSRRLDEVEFVFPVAGSPLRASRLAAAFEPYRPSYARLLGSMEFVPVAGFLRGFVDLVFEHTGRWYVVDYKSNHLGSGYGDYSPEALSAVMDESHYVLQYHLYTVALHRHLSLRLTGYDYDRHFGGVHYLFLRGMSPRLGTGRSVFTDRPPRALVERLSALMDPEARP